jgi:hypothetical protein
LSAVKKIAANVGFINKAPWGSDYVGELLGDYTVTIASRIPESAIQEVREKGGALRLKFRLHSQGVLFGWDVTTLSYQTEYKQDDGYPYRASTRMAGGDFEEAWIYNGKVIKKGWYIHPVTKERIETGF